MSNQAPPPFDPNRRVVVNPDLTWSFVDEAPRSSYSSVQSDTPPPFDPNRRVYLKADLSWTYDAAREHKAMPVTEPDFSNVEVVTPEATFRPVVLNFTSVVEDEDDDEYYDEDYCCPDCNGY